MEEMHIAVSWNYEVSTKISIAQLPCGVYTCSITPRGSKC